MMKMKNTMTLVLPLLLLASCGGDSGGTTATGGGTSAVSAQFIDAPVTGLNYSSTSYSGITGTNGAFDCALGEDVVFKLGTDLTIGTASCGKKIFLSNLDTAAHQYKIGALLQSFGTNGGTSIVIPTGVRTAAVSAKLGVTIANITNGDVSTFATNMNTAFGTSLSAVTLAAAQTHIESSMATHQTYSTSFKEALDALAWFATADGGTDSARYNVNEDVHIKKNADTNCEIDFYLSLYKKFDTVNSAQKENYYVLAYLQDGSAINGTNGELVTGETFSSRFNVTDSGVTYTGGISTYIDITSRKLKGKMIYRVSSGGQSESCSATLNETLTVD